MKTMILILILTLFLIAPTVMAWENEYGMTQLEIWRLEEKLDRIRESQLRAEHQMRKMERERQRQKLERERRRQRLENPTNSYIPKQPDWFGMTFGRRSLVK